MSNLSDQVEQAGDARTERGPVRLLLHPHEKDLGGFSVRRALPAPECRQVGPWVFFDHMGPADFAAGEGIDVRPHPHIHLATVTYLFEGEMLHRDSLGKVQAIRPGDINLMVAGRGIVHSERERPEVRAQAHRQHGLQLWLALPEADEDIEPAFFHHPAAEIPELSVGGAQVRVMMGDAFGVRSPVKTYADTLYVEGKLNAGQSLRLPSAQERAVYVVSGTISLHGVNVPARTMAVVHAEDISLQASESAQFVLIGGAPVGPRYLFWNFVSSRKERIEQAKEDWQAGRFPKIPGDDQEFIPLP